MLENAGIEIRVFFNTGLLLRFREKSVFIVVVFSVGVKQIPFATGKVPWSLNSGPN